MTDNRELLQALKGIQAELQLMNKTLSTIATRQSRTPQSEASRSSFPAKNRPSAGRSQSGGFKRTSEDGEPTGYGEKAARFPKRRSGSVRSKGKSPVKKGSGYPKKSR